MNLIVAINLTCRKVIAKKTKKLKKRRMEAEFKRALEMFLVQDS